LMRVVLVTLSLMVKEVNTPMDFLKTLLENTVTVFFTAFAAAYAQRLAGKRKKEQRKTTPRHKRKGGSSR